MSTRYEPYGIIIDGSELSRRNTRGWEMAIEWHLDLIGRSETGRALLRAIQQTGKRLTIRPWRQSTLNATSRALDARKATARGRLVLGGNPPRPVTRGIFLRQTVEGTGEGSDVVIRYTSSMFGFGGSGAAVFAPGSPGFQPSAALFHEMVHAYRSMRGNHYRGPMTGGRTGYGTEEEFNAILVTNIFVTDPTTAVSVRTLRADHYGFAALAAARATSKGFLADPANKRYVARFASREPGLAADLLTVKATFNPIKELYRPTP